MQKSNIRRLALFTVLGVLLVPFLAFGQQAYDIETGQSGNFAYSYIHSASSAWSQDGDFYNGGSLLLELDGFLGFSISGDILTVNNSTLTASGLGSRSGQSWELSISGGDLDFSVTQGSPAGGALMGSLDYTLDRVGGTDSLEHSGTFYFYNNQFGGPTQTFSSSDLFLWANNWNNGIDSKPGTNAIGIDLGSTNVVPEPLSSTLFVIGSALFGFRRYRVKRRSA